MTDKDTLRTCLSDVDGEAGSLVILGQPLAEVVSRYTYPTLAQALWGVYAPSQSPVVEADFCRAQDTVWQLLQPMAMTLAKQETAISALRLGLEYATAQTPTEITMTLMVSLLLHIKPTASLSPERTATGRFFKALSDDEPGAVHISERARALEHYLMTVSDHGFNASTYTARVIASTGSDLKSCVQGALGALAGPLHGGAPGPVLDMLDAVEAAASPEIWVRDALAQGERIMGFGHRIYRVRDPRADVLKQVLKQLKASGVQPERLARAEQLEAVVLQALKAHKPQRALETNVEYYTALLLDALGFSRAHFTAVFALGRVLGWCAHAMEQQALGRLIRPAGTYIEPQDLLISC